MGIDQLFDEAAEAIKTRQDLGKNDQLKIYALFKQSSAGPASGSRPGMLDPVKRAKWDAWKALGPMSQDDAKRAYCALADEFVPGWRPAEAQGQVAPSEATQVSSISIDKLFVEAAEAIKTRPDLGKEEQLQVYAHYKQATSGPATGSRPGMLDPVKRAKWDAWNKLGSLSQEDAMRGYCGLADQHVPGWRPAGELAQAEPSAPTQVRVLVTLPSMTISVSAPTDELSQTNDVVQFFTISVKPDGEGGRSSCRNPWNVYRRYTQFQDLYTELGSSAQSFPEAAPFPPKLWKACIGAKLETRARGLEAWLQRIIEHPNAKGPWEHSLCNFLEVEENSDTVPTNASEGDGPNKFEDVVAGGASREGGDSSQSFAGTPLSRHGKHATTILLICLAMVVLPVCLYFWRTMWPALVPLFTLVFFQYTRKKGGRGGRRPSNSGRRR